MKRHSALEMTMVVLTSVAIQACAASQPAIKIKNGGSLGATDDQNLPDNIKFMNAKYATDAKAVGMKVCDGAVQFEVNLSAKAGNTTNLFRIPEGRLKCSAMGSGLGGGSGDIDLSKLMGGFGAAPPPGVDPVKIIDNTISLSVMGSGIYTPARPFLPSFVSATPEQLKSMNVTRQISVRDSLTGKVSSGTANLRVLAHGSKYRPAKLAFSHEFKNVLVFELKHTGFDDVQVMKHMLWDRFKMFVSLEPFAILRIEMDATVQDAFDASPDPSGASQQLDQKIQGFTRGFGSLVFGPLGAPLGDLAGKLISNGIKKGTLSVVMDIASMDELKEMVDRIGDSTNGPTSNGGRL